MAAALQGFLMEFLIVVVMILLGVGIAGVIAVAAGAISATDRNQSSARSRAAPDPDAIAASIVYQVAALGGHDPDRVLAFLREARIGSPITSNIHIGNWAEAYRRMSTEAQRRALLDLAVRTAVALSSSLPLAQYNALLELSFGLGFQTDALARLRATYRFDYTDYAKHGRPQSADRAGGGAPLFTRQAADPELLRSVLGLSGPVSRQLLTSTYRKLAAQHHPDRFHGATAAEQEVAAARFIEITEAYEQLLPLCGEE